MEQDLKVEGLEEVEIICELVKSKDEPYGIYIEASMEKLDRQKQIVMMKSLEEQRTNFLKSGILDYDHRVKKTRDPQYIIGEPTDVGFGPATRDAGVKAVFVKGMLYKGVEYAEKIKRLLDAGSTRIGASIDGAILEIAKEVSPLGKSIEKITRVIWDGVAITPTPYSVCVGTRVSRVPIGVFAKSLSDDNYYDPNLRTHCQDGGGKYCRGCKKCAKSMEAGSSTDIAGMHGGQVLQLQSLEGSKKRKLKRIVTALKKGDVEGDVQLLKSYCRDKMGMSNAEAEEQIRLLIENKQEIIQTF